MTVPLFTRKTRFNHTDGEPFRVHYKLHPWIQKALESPENKSWIPNPERPTLLAYENNTIVRLEDCKVNSFLRGDIIWFSYTATCGVGGETWAPEYRLMELIRVGRLPEELISKGDKPVMPSVDPNDWQPFTAGTIISPKDGEYFTFVITPWQY